MKVSRVGQFSESSRYMNEWRGVGEVWLKTKGLLREKHVDVHWQCHWHCHRSLHSSSSITNYRAAITGKDSRTHLIAWQFLALLPSSRHLHRLSSLALSVELDVQTASKEDQIEMLTSWLILLDEQWQPVTYCMHWPFNAVHSFIHYRLKLWSMIKMHHHKSNVDKNSFLINLKNSFQKRHLVCTI